MENNLVESLIGEGWLKTDLIIEAFKKVKRVDFLPEELKYLSDSNQALPIGYGQTISQPLVVAFMFELLQPKPGDVILDIGSGSGWTSALLGYIVSDGAKGKSGKVLGVEIVPELAKLGRKNVDKYGFIKKNFVKIVAGDGLDQNLYLKEGFKNGFDKILCSAAAQDSIPQVLKDNIKINGNIVLPVGESIWKIKRESKKKFSSTEHPGFSFVSLREKRDERRH